MFKQVEIFIDGFCLGNSGFGGYGVIMCYCQYEKIFSVGYCLIINNCMELMVVIVVLEVLKEYCEVVFSIDSQYVCQGIIQWIYNWKKCGWKMVEKKLVKNVDFWQWLDVVFGQYKIKWEWVKGYVGYFENECCDELVCVVVFYFILDDVGYLFES